ncbi:hypothetical protein LINGRAPRIM_LOCUS3207 [Linum grandiflorum]
MAGERKRGKDKKNEKESNKAKRNGGLIMDCTTCGSTYPQGKKCNSTTCGGNETLAQTRAAIRERESGVATWGHFHHH